MMAHSTAKLTGYVKRHYYRLADGTYRPSEPIHRDAMAAFIYRYAHLDT